MARFLTIPPNEFDGSYENGEGKVDALLAQYLPDYDQALLVVNDTAYGGSGGGTPAVVSVNAAAAEVALHESGHSLGVLADEYEDPAPVTPFEAPNSTQETNRNFIRWHDWILASMFIPTPETPGNGAVIGLFEGANYNARGWYRPKLNCKMRDLGVPFCEVCAESLVVNIYRRLSLVDSASPEPDESIPLTTAETKGFSVTALQSAAPTVSAQWFLDDVAVPGATRTTLTVHGAALAAGPHLLRLDLQDETALVRNDPG